MNPTSFANLKATFEDRDLIENFTCIATPYNSSRCITMLLRHQKVHAELLLQTPRCDLDLDVLRDIINCVICRDHQKGKYTHKDKVERYWACEFPEFDFARRRNKSPYTMHSGKIPLHCQRPSLPTPPSSSTSRTELSAPENMGIARGRSPPRMISIGPGRTRQSENDSESLPTQQERPVRTAVRLAPASGDDVFVTENAPSAIRIASPPSAQSQVDARTPNITGSPDVEPTRGDSRTADGASIATAEEESQAGTDASPPDEEADESVPNPFHVGEASTFSPWTIRCEVMSILLEPLPEPKAKGTLYAIQVKDRPYVKIGYTTRKVKERLAEIAAQHHQELDGNTTFKLSRIPLLQLLRLEAVVHADLAFFQRDLRTPGNRRYKTHGEYFEVDLATATRCMMFWWQVMQDIRLEPGKDLDPEVESAIRAHPALNVELSAAEGTAAERGVWHGMNSDHERRENVWNAVFRWNQGGFKRNRDVGIRLGVIAVSVELLLFLPEILDMPSRMAYGVTIVFAAVLMSWV